MIQRGAPATPREPDTWKIRYGRGPHTRSPIRTQVHRERPSERSLLPWFRRATCRIGLRTAVDVFRVPVARKRVARSLLVCASLTAVILLAISAVNAQRRFSVPPSALHARGFRVSAPEFRVSDVVRGVPRRPPTGHSSAHPATKRWSRAHRHRRRRGVFACTGLNLEQPLSPLPGYGFNFEHLNAINGDLAIKAVIDPATELQLQGLEQFGCSEVPGLAYVFSGDDYIVPDETSEESEPSAEPATQPQIIIVQEQPLAPQSPTQAVTPAQPEAPPLPEERQFVLVFRDGSRLGATAFTRQGDKIIFISPDGARRTVALSELDIAATTRDNEDRGTPIQISF